jgi:hypothetical protein
LDIEFNVLLTAWVTDWNTIWTLELWWVLVSHLVPLWFSGVSEDAGLGLADKVAIRVHL